MQQINELKKLTDSKLSHKPNPSSTINENGININLNQNLLLDQGILSQNLHQGGKKVDPATKQSEGMR
jgi:hypothetical protein